jgi:hypothetical protein
MPRNIIVAKLNSSLSFTQRIYNHKGCKIYTCVSIKADKVISGTGSNNVFCEQKH